jgi:SAM-dependent methyltransferase
MSVLNESEARVGRYYDEVIFEAETKRLEDLFPVEFAITARQLERWIPEGAMVAEVGVGGGQYSELLARRGCRLHLVDVSQRLLEATVARLRAGGLQTQLIGSNCASATELDYLPAQAFDAVLLLGPLYHLDTLAARQKAMREAARVLKREGLLFAAGINRLAYLRDLFREAPHKVLARSTFHEQFLRDGKLDPEHAPPIGYAHLTTVAEFKDLFADDFAEAAFLAIESFSGPWQQSWTALPAPEAAAWLDLIERTATMPEAMGITDHFLYIGRRK